MFTLAPPGPNSRTRGLSINGHSSVSGQQCLSPTCKLKPRCTTAVARKVSRDIDEDVREQVRALADTEAFQLSCRERKKREVRFAHMKRILKLDRLRLRGLSGARDEVLADRHGAELEEARQAMSRPATVAMCVVEASSGVEMLCD